jgi:hypothetical protein
MRFFKQIILPFNRENVNIFMRAENLPEPETNRGQKATTINISIWGCQQMMVE